MKPEYFLPIIIVPWLWFFARLALSLWRTDSFLRQLYTNHRDILESLGKPCGWQWRPPGRMSNPFSMFSFRWKWIRSDPDWLQQTPELQNDFYKMRKQFREWNFCAMPIMISTVIIFFVVVKLLEKK